MKTTKLLIPGLCALVLAFACIACEGTEGPAGANGATGAAGVDGAVFVWKGTYANEIAFTTANGTPKNGWAYYDETLKQSRIYNNGAWDILAGQGIPGESGGDGDTPYIGENGNWWIGDYDTGELVDGVLIISPPTKTLYSPNETFTSAGLLVTVYYTGGASETINSANYSLYWNDAILTNGNTAITAETGNKTITVKWHNKIVLFTILVQN